MGRAPTTSHVSRISGGGVGNLYFELQMILIFTKFEKHRYKMQSDHTLLPLESLKPLVWHKESCRVRSCLYSYISYSTVLLPKLWIQPSDSLR